MSKCLRVWLFSMGILACALIPVVGRGVACYHAVQLGKTLLQVEDATYEMASHCHENACSSQAMTEAVDIVLFTRAAFVTKGKQCLGE